MTTLKDLTNKIFHNKTYKIPGITEATSAKRLGLSANLLSFHLEKNPGWYKLPPQRLGLENRLIPLNNEERFVVPRSSVIVALDSRRDKSFWDASLAEE